MTGLQTTPAVHRARAQWPRATLRIGFGVIWLVDAAMKWLPGFRSAYRDGVPAMSAGQPGWLQPWYQFWIGLQRPNLTFFAYLVAALETLTAVALIAGFARKLTYVLALVFSLLIWGVAEGFGGPYSSGSTDIGAAVMYAVVFAALLGFDYSLGADPLAVDSYLERRISWWHWIAEVGNHGHDVTGGATDQSASRRKASAPAGPSRRTA